jgi:DNA-binding transcriptional LysR family regulator
MMGGVVRVSVQRWMKSAILKEARYSKYANVKRILDKHSFDRSPEGLAPTPVCLSYHDRIAGAFTELRLATAPLKPESGKVLTNVTPTFVSKWLVPKLPDFARLRTHNQNRTVAARAIADMKTFGHLS